MGSQILSVADFIKKLNCRQKSVPCAKKGLLCHSRKTLYLNCNFEIKIKHACNIVIVFVSILANKILPEIL